MQKKFLSGIILLLLFNFLVKPFWVFGIDISVQNAVGNEQYGLYFSLFSFSFLFNILLDLGITNFNNRNIAQNNQLITKHFSSLVCLKLVLALVYLAVTFIVGGIIGYSSQHFYLLLWLCINQFLSSFILYVRSNLSALLMFKTDSVLSVLDKILMCIFCGILLWGGVTSKPFKIEWLVYSQTAAYLTTAIIAFAAVAYNSGFRKLNWNYKFFIAIIKQSLPYATLVLLMGFYSRIDSVMIERILPALEGDYQAGIYAGAFRILDALNMVGYLVSVPLLPVFAKILKDKQDVQKILKLAFSFLFIVSTTISIACFFYGSSIMDLLYKGRHVEEYANVFRILIFSFIPFSLTYVFGTLLTANGSLKQLNLIALSGMILNIVLNLILIPSFKSVGAAYVGLATQSVTALIQIVLAVWLFKFNKSYLYLLKLCVFVLGTVFICWLLASTKLNWIVAFVTIFVSTTAFSIVLKLFQPKKILNILKQPSE